MCEGGFTSREGSTHIIQPKYQIQTNVECFILHGGKPMLLIKDEDVKVNASRLIPSNTPHLKWTAPGYSSLRNEGYINDTIAKIFS